MAGTVADRRAPRVVGALVVLFAGLTGCTGRPVEDPPVGRDPEGNSMSAGTVRTDREPISRRFPKLGDFVEVHWQGSVVGASSSVPGPSDVLIQGLVVLRPEDLAAARTGYQWEPAPAGWDAKVPDLLRPLAPASGDWRHNAQFESEVSTTRYSGDVYLDLSSGTVYLDVNSR